MLKHLFAFLPVVFLLGCPEPRIIHLNGGPAHPPVDTGSEVLNFLVPEGSTQVSAQTGPGIQLAEYVPEGQSAEQWSDMLTAVIMERSAAPDIDAFFEHASRFFKNGCGVEPIVAEPTRFFDGPYPAGTQMAVCGKTSRGFAEVVIYKMIQGTKGFYQVQRAWRFPPAPSSKDIIVSEDMIETARDTLATMHVCDRKTDLNNCKSLPAT